jgi:hypothetical protein
MESERKPEAAVGAVPQQRQTVLWIIAILLAIIATTLIVRSQDPLALPRAYGDQPVAGAHGVYAFTGQLDKNRYGLFMMDVDSSCVWCYEYLPGTRKLHLVAARSFRFDRYLENYMNDQPFMDEVQAMLKEQNRIKQRNEGGVVPPEEKEKEEDALGTRTPGITP